MYIQLYQQAKHVVEAGTNALSLINTIQSVTGIDLDTLVPNPYVAGKSRVWWLLRAGSKTHCIKNAGNYSQNEVTNKVPVSGIGGVSTWKDAVEFMLARCKQCAGMHGRYEAWFQDN